MRLTTFRACLLLLSWFCQPAHAQEADEAIRKAIDSHFKRYLVELPGKSSYSMGTIDTRGLGPCSRVDVTPTAGAAPWGRSSLRVRCVAGAAWSLLVPVRIHVIGPYVLTARPVGGNQSIEAADLHVQEGDLSELPANVITDPAQALGRFSRNALPAGKPLRADSLKAATVVLQGQSVKVVSRGAGFEVANEGKALGNAVAGQVVQVRLGSGQIVSGVADGSGNVEVNF